MGTILFILVGLFIVYSLIAIITYFVRGKVSKAKGTFLRLTVVIAIYFVVLLATSLLSKSETLPLAQDKCFDEWCVAVMGVEESVPQKGMSSYAVSLKVTNKGRGRAQRPDNPYIYAIDDQGNRYNESVSDKSEYEAKFGKQLPIGSLIEAQKSFNTTMTFRIPSNRKAYVVLTEGGWPTYFIIDDEGSLLHKASLTPLN